ncbi:hypothetical protein F4818DRAFT_457464 [Hypoxylon cercidicola]|nr:hypothetical protein F4818DRAFT_457464 [Hypoxylon cercidicola]
MLEHFLNTFYPPIEDRAPLPILYIPGTIAVLVLGYAIGPGPIRTTAVGSLLLLLALQRPYYTAGGVTLDYSLSGGFVFLLLEFLDLSISDPRWIGKQQQQQPGGPKAGGSAWRDLETWPQRLRWGARLATTTRGVGWDWQVKSVPAHREPDAPRLRFAAGRALDLARHVALKSLAVYGIGFCRTVGPAAAPWAGRLLGAAENWCGAAWSWNTIGIAHAGGAVATVLLGISEPWQYPPMLGSLRTAWSVRQVWSVSYHQIFRRVVQQPGIRLARFLGFKKGSVPSRYFQLYLAFYISFCVHWWQQYVTTRSDKGEFAFFMMQPVVITIEDFVQWVWRGIVSPEQKQKLRWLELLVGYVWTFAAFTFTLTPYVKGMTETGIIGLGGPEETTAMMLGQRHGAAYLEQ